MIVQKVKARRVKANARHPDYDGRTVAVQQGDVLVRPGETVPAGAGQSQVDLDLTYFIEQMRGLRVKQHAKELPKGQHRHG